ncbi:MAG TPA: asparaginase [Actinomycetota bacterium]|nr:asparaginase [Actinomycetota bacterium]
MASAVPLVRVTRSGVIESVHAGHVAVCDADGRLLARLGDPDRLLFSRSATKPLQAAVSLRRMGEDLPEDLIAIMCASHNAEPVHRAAVRRLLRRGGVPVSALGCPPAFPLSTTEARRVARPTRLQHNCSGKHAGMLVASLRSGWALPTYLSPEHPLQREISGAVRTATGFRRPVVGVDGCGAPVHGVPLRAMATLFARLARPERMGRYASTAARAVAAMRSHPYLVAGSGRSDTLLMAEVPGVVSKVGAEALHCAAIVDEGIGVAVRIEDGGERASGPALIHALAQLGAISDEQLGRLAPVARRPVLGGGDPVGEVVADFRLRTSRP